MPSDRFTVNPFADLALSASDTSELEEIADRILLGNLPSYNDFLNVQRGRVNPRQWKSIKTKGAARVYAQRQQKPTALPKLLCVGTSIGTLDDVMFGVVNPTLEAMRIKASYVSDISGAAVLETVVEPTLENPFKSVVVKWMELDIPLHSTTLVKNRDYVYVETTGMTELSDGEKVGYHVLHSVNFPQTHALPGRVRANLSICAFFRQTRSNAVEIYVMGLMDSAGDHMKRLLVPSMASAFLSTLKYAHCGRMKKLAYMLEKRCNAAKELGAPSSEPTCVSCVRPLRSRRLGDFGKSDSACKLCFGHLCSSCKQQKKLSFVTADLRLTRRKVTFCAACLHGATHASAEDAAKAQVLHGDQFFRGKGRCYSSGSTSVCSSTSSYSYSSSFHCVL